MGTEPQYTAKGVIGLMTIYGIILSTIIIAIRYTYYIYPDSLFSSGNVYMMMIAQITLVFFAQKRAKRSGIKSFIHLFIMGVYCFATSEMIYQFFDWSYNQSYGITSVFIRWIKWTAIFTIVPAINAFILKRKLSEKRLTTMR